MDNIERKRNSNLEGKKSGREIVTMGGKVKVEERGHKGKKAETKMERKFTFQRGKERKGRSQEEMAGKV